MTSETTLNEPNTNETNATDRKRLSAKQRLYYRDVLRLYVEQGLPAAEVAARLGLSRNTVGAWVKAGRLDALRRRYWFSSPSAVLELQLMLQKLIEEASVAAKGFKQCSDKAQLAPNGGSVKAQLSTNGGAAKAQLRLSEAEGESAENRDGAGKISLEALNKMAKIAALIEKVEGLPMPLRSYTHFAPDLLKWCREHCADDAELLERMGGAVEGYGAELLEKN